MGQLMTWTVTAPQIDKVQGAALAIEFWTSLGFETHSSSYNCLVLRRNKYGTAGDVLGGLFGEEPWDAAPLQLTVLIQELPSQVKFNLKFEVGFGRHEQKEGDFNRSTKVWIDDFISFINEWTGRASKIP
jgi:hypothetical protein